MSTTMTVNATNPVEQPYLALLGDVLARGERVPTRAVLGSTGETVEALSVFGAQIRIDLSLGFPAVTTKRLNFHAVATELAWFLSGSTNINYLVRNGVHIWDEWADEWGDVGPSYGSLWRAWPPRAPGDAPVDQVARLVSGIRTVLADPGDSRARRLLLTAWDPASVPRQALPPCHVLAQFRVDAARRLSCHLVMRSADVFLGVPFNLASYALLTHLLAAVAGPGLFGVGDLIVSFGDVHIYANHVEQAREQLGRKPFPPPRLRLTRDLGSINDFRREHVELDGYECHPAIRGEVAI